MDSLNTVNVRRNNRIIADVLKHHIEERKKSKPRKEDTDEDPPLIQ